MKSHIKHMVWTTADILGIPYFFHASQKKQARIFLYHGVAPARPNDGIFNYRKKCISPDAFRNQIKWITSHYTILPLSTLIKHMQTKKVFQPNSCAITFDDGYENNYTHAFPILKEFKVPATIFLTTDFVDQKIPLWVDALEYAIGHTDIPSLTLSINEKNRAFPLTTQKEKITADALLRSHLKTVSNEKRKEILRFIIETTQCDLSKRLDSSGYQALTWEYTREMQKFNIDFAGHTNTHPILSRISHDEAREEIMSSHRRVQETLGNSLPIFAYPNGQANDFTTDTKNILKNEGFVAGLTTIPGTLSHNTPQYEIPRITLDNTDNQAFFRMTATGARMRLKKLFGRT